jgi:lysozyme
MIDGVDLSVANDSLLTHADDVNFEKVYASGKRFAIFKATEAEHYVDPQFLAFVDRASKTPLRLGAYPFARVDEDPNDDVAGFVKATEPVVKKLTLAPLYDLETRSKGFGAQQTLDFTMGWMLEHVRLRGCGIILYSFGAFLRELVKDLGGPKSAGALELVQFPLAIAHYTAAAAPDLSGLPWTTWALWQWAASMPGGPIGKCDGVTGAVDLNRFNGSLEDLAWLGSGPPP